MVRKIGEVAYKLNLCISVLKKQFSSQTDAPLSLLTISVSSLYMHPRPVGRLQNRWRQGHQICSFNGKGPALATWETMDTLQQLHIRTDFLEDKEALKGGEML